MKNLKSRAMLVNLQIGSWSARKHDKRVSLEIDQEHGTKRAAGRYNKILIDLTQLKKIHNIAAETRIYVEQHSSPWLSRGSRLITPEIYFDFTREIRERKEKFWKLYEEFEKVYPELREAARDELADLFDPDDYPEVYDIRKKFYFTITITPIPDVDLMNDWRIGLGEEEVARIKKETEETLNETFKAGVLDLWDKLYKVVSHAVSVFSNPNAKKIHASLITNIVEQIQVLGKLNFTKDPTLEQVRQKTEATIAQMDVTEIRKFPQVKAKALEHGKEILADIKKARSSVTSPKSKEANIVKSMSAYM